MSKNRKKLLNENTIRRMMKLAEIDSLSETFITDKFTVNEQDEEADFELSEPGMEEPPVDLPPDPEVEDEDAPAEGGAEEMAMEFAQALAGVAEKFGVEMDVQGADEEAAPEEEFPEEPAELDMAPEDEELPPAGGDDVMEGLEKEDIELKEDEDADLKEDEDADLKEEDDEKLEERLANEIARRVAARLVKESRQDKMADQLAERIMARLSDKK